jgi:hypothetical protein
MVGKDDLTENIKVLVSMSPAKLRQTISDFPSAKAIASMAPQKLTQSHVTASIMNLFNQSF